MSKAHTESLNRLISEFSNLPGIGPKTAERLAYHLLKQSPENAMKLAIAIKDVKTEIRNCSRCFNLCESELCEICTDTNREHATICVVEQPNDLINLEETGMCKWSYHVLLGHLAPLDGITPDHLTIDALLNRVKQDGITEVVMATNPNMEGDGTALYLSSLLNETDVKITRLARGLPSGGSIEYASKNILNDAILGRIEMH